MVCRYKPTGNFLSCSRPFFGGGAEPRDGRTYLAGERAVGVALPEVAQAGAAHVTGAGAALLGLWPMIEEENLGLVDDVHLSRRGNGGVTWVSTEQERRTEGGM